MNWTHVYENTMLRGTDETGNYTECKYVKKENGENDIDATKQKILEVKEIIKLTSEAPSNT